MITIKGVVYPPTIGRSIALLRHNGQNPPSAEAVSANFNCGSFIKFTLSIDSHDQAVTDASVSSNGCGFMLAAADVLAQSVVGRNLIDLHGLGNADLKAHIQTTLGKFPIDRQKCADTCIEALHAAFADYRQRRREEFKGEQALVCTCFGVTEETIDAVLAKHLPKTINEVAELCNAGRGCGSCRMLVQEMIDGFYGII